VPSENLVYYKLPLYPEQAAEVEQVVADTKVKTAKLFRAAVMLVLGDSDLKAEAIRLSKESTYRKTGANIGKWKSHIRQQESKRAQEKLKVQEDDGEY